MEMDEQHFANIDSGQAVGSSKLSYDAMIELLAITFISKG